MFNFNKADNESFNTILRDMDWNNVIVTNEHENSPDITLTKMYDNGYYIKLMC